MDNNNFKEEDIRPNKFLADQEVCILKDIGYLLSKVDSFVEINCPACNSNSFVSKYKKMGFNYVECKICKTIYTNPRPTTNILDDFYSNSYNYDYWNKYIFPASEKIRREKIFKPRVDKIIDLCDKYSISKNSLLEVGSGFGTFCEEVLGRGIFKRVIGVEPTSFLAETSRNKGITIIEKSIENINLNEDDKFEVIVNFEVIEHLFSPTDFILQCNKLLKPNGLFVATCPNGQGFDILTLGEISNTIDHEHLNYFNTKSLSHLLDRNGFDVLEVSTPGILDVDIVRNAVISGKYTLSGQPFLQEVLMNDDEKKLTYFQSYLIKNNLSSNMWIVAKKKSNTL